MRDRAAKISEWTRWIRGCGRLALCDVGHGKHGKARPRSLEDTGGRALMLHH